jgi:hypothetical protein
MEAEVEAELERWAAGEYYPLKPEDQARLDTMVAANLDLSWRTILRLAKEAPDRERAANLSIAPLPAALEAGGEPMFKEAAALARENPKLATALYDCLALEWRLAFYRIFGRDRLVETYLRHQEKDTEFDNWAVFLVLELLEEDRAEAWDLVRALVNAAPSHEVLAVVAAGPVEDFILLQAPESVDLIEQEARANPKFRQALRGVWIMRLAKERPDLFDRVEAAAGERLRRE